MKKILLMALLLLLGVSKVNAQTSLDKTLNGIVYGANDKGKEPLDGAVIKWINTRKGDVTSPDGKFSLSAEGISDKRIIVFYVGYKRDTINAEGKNFVEVVLQNNFSTQQIVVESKVNSSFIENGNAKTEVITQGELKKAACCDLSGMFGSNTTVEVTVSDILTNTKELKMLGLEGAYTQVLLDNMPIMSGLVTKYGVTSIPGTLVNKITISKGSNSVMQGYESISGIMNVLLKDYNTSDAFLFNGYLNSMLEKQINLNTTAKINNWKTLLAFQTVQEAKRLDENGDGFLDAPLTTRYMFFNKWKYGNTDDDFTNVTIGLKYLDEKRIGGQKNFDYNKDLGSNTIYGQTVNIQNGDAYTRISQEIGADLHLKLYAAGSFFNQESYYGVTKYDAKQRNFYTNATIEIPVGLRSYVRLGTSYKYEKINEDIKFLQPENKTYAGPYEKLESIAGVFSEASLDFKNLKSSVVGGLRLDYHNKYNLIATPRVMLRFQLSKETTIRATAGTGFRTINLFSENSNLLASGRNILVPQELKPEKMINYGIDVLQYFDFGKVSGNLNLDFYRTEFSNKIMPDYTVNPLAVTFMNVSDAATNVFQIESTFSVFNNVDFKLAYKYIDQYYYHKGMKMQQPFNSKHRVVSSLHYSPKDNNWNANVSLQWFGVQALPSTKDYPVELQRPSESDPYTIVNGQFTKNFKHFEAYVGVENIFDFRQQNPIVDPAQPFSPYFDTSYIWGPTTGRTFYFGFRLLFNKL
ncbi:MAG: TonB-dependent receptor [Ignavibacteriae bacterium]|nr:TonB-dependent receptor [Ignavibacteriota bacterium]